MDLRDLTDALDPLEDALDQLGDALDQLAARDPSELAGCETIESLFGSQARLEAVVTTATAAVEASGTWGPSVRGTGSVAGVWHHRCPGRTEDIHDQAHLTAESALSRRPGSGQRPGGRARPDLVRQAGGTPEDLRHLQRVLPSPDPEPGSLAAP